MSDSETNQPSRPPVEPGTVLAGKYRVERIIGQGGMGVVVEARHVVLDERVALKFLLPEFTRHPEGAARFLREAKAGMRVRSEHVARVSDVGTLESGAPYMVMEYLVGSDLARLIRDQGVLGLEDAVDYVVQGSEAIAEAHGLGIVHRDLKPANLFLTSRADGSPLVKVLDFGISKMATGAVDILTGTDAALGSALYMSPEQMRQTRSVDHRTDIYALGVSLYELLAGRQPYYAETLPQLCAEVLTGTPTPLRDIRHDMPAALATVLERAYAREREHRYASVAELVVALAPFAPARTYPTIDRIARMGGLSLRAAVGGHRASQPSFTGEARASAPALREPSWPGISSPPPSGQADAPPLRAPTPYPHPQSPFAQAPGAAHAPTPYPHPQSPFAQAPGAAHAPTPYPHPQSPFAQAPPGAGGAPGPYGAESGRPSPVPYGAESGRPSPVPYGAESGRPSPVPPEGLAPNGQQQIVPGPYNGPVSSRAAATFASSTTLGLSTEGRRIPGLQASPAVVAAIALLSATLLLGVIAVGVFLIRGFGADDAGGTPATLTEGAPPATPTPETGTGAGAAGEPTVRPTGAANDVAATGAAASAPADATASAAASAPADATASTDATAAAAASAAAATPASVAPAASAPVRAPAARNKPAPRPAPPPVTQRPSQGIDLNDPH
ncbi:protein kinase domain-containing protein [Sorangium sp. So ce854]|uniref:serine/threonine-protein kinase n=1 Tax=Sorangium sp. So ce854 TaxID=3133322 RepID=UPI003F632C02